MKEIAWRKLSEEWIATTEIVLYGYGRVAQRNIKKLAEDFSIKFIIDKIPMKNGWKDIPIVELKQVKEELFRYKVVVATSSLAYESIKAELEVLGLKEYINFCRLEQFMPEWYWRNKQQVCVSQILSAITTRCTFKCKYCSNLMPYFKEQYEYDVASIVDDLYYLFKRVDYLASYYIIGGEPLLNKALADMIEQIVRLYGNKIGFIQIVTNGSIVPDNKLLDVVRKYNIHIRVSDYTRAIPYQKKYNEVIECLKTNHINYSVSDYTEWMNLGFPKEEVVIDTNLEEHMRACSQGCHSVNDKKFYYCSTLWDAEKSGLYNLQEGECIDLTRFSGDQVKDKEMFLNYLLGYMENGHIGLCAKCRGFGADNLYVVNVAEQYSLEEELNEK